MATIEELLAALEALPQHFRALAPSEAAADQAASAAQLLDTLVQSVPPAYVSRTWDTVLERCAAEDAMKLASVARVHLSSAGCGWRCQRLRKTQLHSLSVPLSAGQWWRQRTAWQSWRQQLPLPWSIPAMRNDGCFGMSMPAARLWQAVFCWRAMPSGCQAK